MGFGNAIKDYLFGGDRTVVVGTVIKKRTDMGDSELYTEYPRTHYYMRISATEMEVPKRIYESAHEG
ncbi:MAG: hypothetical protein IH960_11775 [Chloroflexi bacterium]|nr:hypothetical protein [Chloroflexota bacterium]